MKRKWWLVPVVLALIGVLWILASDEARLEPLRAAVGLKPVSVERAKSKPICSQVIVPAGDCIPQHLAHLPPDPGREGMKTLEGIDADRDGVRDDVQRFIFIEYGHSQRAVAALTTIAKYVQWKVKTGDSISSDEAYARVKDDHIATCYARSLDRKDIESNALSRIQEQVLNTPKRREQAEKFERLLTWRGFMLPDFEEPLEKLCGYDPAKLAN